FEIQWTELVPAKLPLKVKNVRFLEIETCSEPRPQTTQPTLLATGESGVIWLCGSGDRLIHVPYHAVMVKFFSRKFTASLQYYLSRVKVHSVTPNWQPTEDLRSTRIRDAESREVLLFKEVDWQTTRIEANAADESLATTPLRFIANQSKIRIAMKKSLNDCSILTSRVMLLLDDLLWVLTTTQLKAAILYINSMKEMIEKSALQSKKLAADKLQQQVHASVHQPQQHSRPRSQSASAIGRGFSKFDILTTSYHLITSRIDLHLCDDSATDSNASPKHNNQIEGGAMQITFFRLSTDYYPYHLAGGERKQWYRYTDNLGSRNSWVRKLFEDFRRDVAKARETCCVPSPSQSPAHNSMHRKSPEKTMAPEQTQQRTGAEKSQSASRLSPSHTPRPKATKLMECCMVLKIEDFHIYRVTTADNKRNVPHKFLSSDKKQLHLPPDMSVVHMEYTDYFFTEGINYPVPHSNLYVLVNPIRLTIDYLTLLWMNYFALNLSQNIDIPVTDDPVEHVDIKLEAVMPRIIVPASKKVECQPDRPEGLQLQFSRLCVSNTRVEEGMMKDDLLRTLKMYSDGNLFSSVDYPRDNSQFVPIPKGFWEHAQSTNNPYITKYAKGLLQGCLPDNLSSEERDVIVALMKVNTLKLDSSQDVWGICIDQLWVEFVGTPNCRSRPIPFVESFPLSLWFYRSGSRDGSHDKTNGTDTCDKKIDDNGKQSNSSQNEHDTSKPREPDGDHCVLNPMYDLSKADKGDSPRIATREDNSYVQCTVNRLADCYVVAKFGSKIRAELNHFQYLFLLRMLESFSDFQVQLNVDMEKYAPSGSPINIIAPLIIPDIEFAIVCPYVSELLQISTADELNSAGTSHGKDLEFDDSDQEGAAMLDSYTNSDSSQSLSQVSTPLSKSQSDSRIQLHTCLDAVPSISEEKFHLSFQEPFPGSQGLPASQSSDSLSFATSDCVSYRASDGNILPLSLANDSGYGSDKSKSTVKKMNRAADQMKKSFTSAMTSFTDRLKTKEDFLNVPDDLETMSIKTDMSDDEDFEFLAFEEEQPAFSHVGQSDAASSTDTEAQDDLSSLYAESSIATKGKELISVIIFRLRGTEAILESIGQDIVLGLQTAILENLETGNIYMEEFSTKFTSKGFFCHDEEDTLLEASHFPLRMKYLLGPAAELQAPKSGERGYINVRLDSHKMELKMSSTISLSNFIEDEIIPEAVPMHITISDLELTLQEDRPSINMTSPGPIPINLVIQRLIVTLGEDGVFHINGDVPSIPSHTKDFMAASIDTLQPDMVVAPSTTPSQETSTSSINSSMSPATKLSTLQLENSELKKSLNEIKQSKKKQDDKIENLMQSVRLVSDLRTENKRLQEQLKKFTSMSNGDVCQYDTEQKKTNSEVMENENLKLQQRLATLEDDFHLAVKEKESLIATLKLLQDELFASEQNLMRQSDHRRK
ncbi:hypothetical protein ScPMuIL_016389, partial [Solemya velum]